MRFFMVFSISAIMAMHASVAWGASSDDGFCQELARVAEDILRDQQNGAPLPPTMRLEIHARTVAACNAYATGRALPLQRDRITILPLDGPQQSRQSR